MALPAGRVGVKKTDVDWQGNVKASGGGSSADVNKLKSQIGTFEFLVQDGVAGYKKTGADTFTPFRTGGSIASVEAVGTGTSKCTVLIAGTADTVDVYRGGDRAELLGTIDISTIKVFEVTNFGDYASGGYFYPVIKSNGVEKPSLGNLGNNTNWGNPGIWATGDATDCAIAIRC